MESDEYALMDAVEARMWWYRALHARLLDALADAPDPVLDAGCGTGGFLSRLAPSRAVFGLEWHADAATIAADVLCHAAVEPAHALAEIRRVLRPGGRLVVNMPAYRALMSSHDVRVHNARRMNAGETRTMLETAGFRVLKVRYWNGLLLPLMIVRRKILARSSDRSDVAAFPPWLDRMLHGMTELERRLPFPLPAGGSVLAIAERP